MDGTECAPGKVAASFQIRSCVLMLFRAPVEHTGALCKCHPHLSVTFCPPVAASGALRATASGDPARSLRDTTAAGAPGLSLAPVPGRAEAAFAPAAGSATTLRESRSREENFPAQIVYMVFVQRVMQCCKCEIGVG